MTRILEPKHSAHLSQETLKSFGYQPKFWRFVAFELLLTFLLFFSILSLQSPLPPNALTWAILIALLTLWLALAWALWRLWKDQPLWIALMTWGLDLPAHLFGHQRIHLNWAQVKKVRIISKPTLYPNEMAGMETIYILTAQHQVLKIFSDLFASSKDYEVFKALLIEQLCNQKIAVDVNGKPVE